MKINPIGTQYIRPYYKPQINTTSFGDKTPKPVSVAYPRRYLPQDYHSGISSKTFDSFTNLRDKNYLLYIVNCAIQNSLLTGEKLSIAMFDMDNFKSVNEFLGYKTGDDFIKEIANEVSHVATKHFLNAYRFGGEEFVIFMDSRSPKEQEAIAQDVIKGIKENEFIQSNSSIYIENAKRRLKENEDLNAKISLLIPLKAKKQTLQDLQKNFTTREAKEDSYLKQSIEETDSSIKELYLSLINERMASEDRRSIKTKLKNIKEKFEKGTELDPKEKQALDEYLLSIYDKNYEIYQIKRWISDFEANKGFSITGGVVSYTPESLQNRTAIDIINDAGETLKEGKKNQKGKSYFR